MVNVKRNYYIRVVCIAAAVCLILTAFSSCDGNGVKQLPSGETYNWANSFGGTGSDYFYSVAQAYDKSGYVAVGKTESKDGDLSDLKTCEEYEDGIIAKYAPDGSLIWSKTISGNSFDTLYNIKAVEDGYIISGWSYSALDDFENSGNKGQSDSVIIKIDLEGETKWIKTFGGSDKEVFTGLSVDGDGNIYASGFTYSEDHDLEDIKYYGGIDAIACKFDKDGELIWSNHFGGSVNDSFCDVAYTEDGGCLAIGYSSSSDGGMNGIGDGETYRAIVVRFDSNGKKLWSKNFGGSSHEAFNAITIADGSYYLTGYAMSQDEDMADLEMKGVQDGLIAKIDADGNFQWIKTFGGSKIEDMACVTPAPNGGIYVCGYTASDDHNLKDLGGHGRNDAVVMQYSADGELLKTSVFGGTGDDIFQGCTAADDGSIIAVGQTKSGDDMMNGLKHKGLFDAVIVSLK